MIERLYGGKSMKKGIIIVGEIILVLAILAFFKTGVASIFPATADPKVTRFVFYCMAGVIAVLIYRFNTKNK